MMREVSAWITSWCAAFAHGLATLGAAYCIHDGAEAPARAIPPSWRATPRAETLGLRSVRLGD